ncbi:RNA polymerase I-specific transcription initiation factor RRN3 [Mycena alexandri]|uniref:RNA polymerase I-specific transcription initiation factor RRN3 n=1 Tax=Mycena alexandri TaxID=1745969 RepID=A0AAD6TDT9_9AGAR|nr:RNA polymerase I-specific transcription initiation factor RRN3 [Mycena alexandri]
MDPHSTLSQFNQRAPRAGPMSLKYMEVQQSKPGLDSFPKRPSASRKASPSPAVLIRRPIATNSRVKQDEKYRKDMHLAFVNNALLQKANGISEPFDELVNQFSTKTAPQPAQLRLWISALSHVVSRLERSHSTLVQAVVSMPWTTLDGATVKAYTVFIGMLLSARPEYLSLVLGKITHGFTYQFGIQALDTNTPEGSSSPLTRRVIYDRFHYLLRHLLSLIPTLSSTLQPLLVRNFPHKRQNQASQSTYIRNLLRISTYCPELSDKILSTIVDRAIQIDVEIQVELEELEDQNEDQDVFELDPFDTILGQEDDNSDSDDDGDDDGDMSDLSSDGGGDIDEAETPSDVGHIQDMVKKLDAILTLVFEHFQRALEAIPAAGGESPRTNLPPELPALPPLPPLTPMTPSLSPLSSPMQLRGATTLPDYPFPDPTRPPASVQPPPTSLNAQFQTLLSIFDRLILPTFKSRYTQFLVFFYTSLSSDFADIFLGLLVDRALFQNETPAVTRAAAAAYIGSFVSRAAFVDREGARRVVGVLCDFLRAHLDGVEEGLRIGAVATSGPGSSAQSGVFYAVAQTVFLIFCFRWRDLLEDNEVEVEELVGKPGKKWMPELGVVQRIIHSVLNPLKLCSPNVVGQFAHVAQSTGFIYCFTIIEANKRSEYGSNNAEGRVSVGTPGTNGASSAPMYPAVLLNSSITAELNTFFPFDPYKLAKSSVYIQSIYREWSSVAIDDEDEDEEEEGEGYGDVPASSSYDEMRYLTIPSSQGPVDDDGLGESLGAMSISPVRPTPLRM